MKFSVVKELKTKEEQDLELSLEEYTAQTRERLTRKIEAQYLKDGINCEIYCLSPAEHRNTALWSKTRAWILHRDSNTCQSCGAKPRELDVHHRNYERTTMEGRDPDSLISLCRKCHNLVEYIDGDKRYKRDCEQEKEEVLLELLRKGE